jgi:chromosome transmission fidelity protein 1
VTLPYNLLLQKSAREALGIKLEGNIVIIDEAHSKTIFLPSRMLIKRPADLIPTLLSLSTVHLTSPTLSLSFRQVCIYVSRFKTRLSPANMLHLKRLVVVLESLKAYAAKWNDEKTSTKDNQPEVMTVGELISRLGKKVAGINLMEVEGYLKKSKVCD